MIKLKVPKKEGLPESVNQGNFYADLKPGGTVKTESREFADWLIREFELEEVAAKEAAGDIAEGGAK